MDAASTRLGIAARLLGLGLLLSAVILLAERGRVGEHRNTTFARAIPLVPLTDAKSETGFAGIERALSRLPIRAGEGVKVDSALMSALAAAVESMPDTLPAEGIERIESLLHKGWPADAAEPLSYFLMQYHAFRQAEKRLLNEMAATTIEADESSLAALRVAQTRYFDPAIARSLFGEQNALAAYSLQLRRLDEDPTRTEAEKAVARVALQRDYELEIQSLRESSLSLMQ